MKNWIQWIQGTSIDAPIIACIWSFGIQKNFKNEISWVSLGILFGATFLVYLADRMQDVSSASFLNGKPSGRHEFVRCNQKWLGVIWLIVFLTTVSIALTQLDVSILKQGFYLLSGVVVYLLTLKIKTQGWGRIIYKMLIVSFLFAGGVLTLSGGFDFFLERPFFLFWFWLVILVDLIGVFVAEHQKNMSPITGKGCLFLSSFICLAVYFLDHSLFAWFLIGQIFYFLVLAFTVLREHLDADSKIFLIDLSLGVFGIVFLIFY